MDGLIGSAEFSRTCPFDRVSLELSQCLPEDYSSFFHRPWRLQYS